MCFCFVSLLIEQMQVSIDLELSLSQTELENGLESEVKSLPLSNEVSEQYNQLQFYKRYDFIKNVSSKKVIGSFHSSKKI